MKASWALFRAIEDADKALDLDPQCVAALVHRARCMDQVCSIVYVGVLCVYVMFL